MPEPRSIDFEGLTIRYDDRLLTPRAWTAAQSAWAAEVAADAAQPGPLLDLCAGAGHIGLLAAARTGRRLVAVDANPAAEEFVLANAEHAGVEVDVRIGPMDEVLGPDECFPVVIADPPWVPSDEVARFPEDPRFAIDGGEDGLDVVRVCVDVVARHLTAGGSAILQVGTGDQAVRTAALLTADHDLVVTGVRGLDRGSLLRLDRPRRDA